MKIKDLISIAIVCIIHTKSTAQEDLTIDAAKNLCFCLDEVTMKKNKLEKIIATAKDKKVAEIEHHSEQIEILENIFDCMSKITKDELWKKENNRLIIYEYIKNNCNNYKGLIIFDKISAKSKATVEKNEIENKRTAIDYRNLAFEAFDKGDMFNIRKHCRKAIELDPTNTEKDIISEHFFRIAKNWLQTADDYEKKGNLAIARSYRSDAHLPLTIALDFGNKNLNEIGKVIYNNLMKLGDKVGANLYQKYN
ncbi:hypothetical protein [Flavobacterium flavipallidum]|uniref:Tetratricopeptide repeat protein n=1 Tax=Flavobacterium flavipallidum TaxID=3139140 RepID=A0ABU9HNS6_9FLAO